MSTRKIFHINISVRSLADRHEGIICAECADASLHWTDDWLGIVLADGYRAIRQHAGWCLPGAVNVSWGQPLQFWPLPAHVLFAVWIKTLALGHCVEYTEVRHRICSAAGGPCHPCRACPHSGITGLTVGGVPGSVAGLCISYCQLCS